MRLAGAFLAIAVAALVHPAWARTVVAAFDAPENAGKGVLKVEGRMVERLHLAQARRLMAVADAIAVHEAGGT